MMNQFMDPSNSYILYFSIGILVAVVLIAMAVMTWHRRRRGRVGSRAPKAETHESNPLSTATSTPATLPVSHPPSPKDFKSLLAKTQAAFTAKLDALLLSTKSFDAHFLESLEELLYTSDLGPKSVEKLLLAVRGKVSRGELSDLNTVKKALYEEVLEILSAASGRAVVYSSGRDTPSAKPWIILVVGINGVGKTTSIGKLAKFYKNQGKKVLVVAGDTFRAAAEEQLGVWGNRAGVDVYVSTVTKDAAAVAFQGIEKGKAEGADIIVVDTAGRLHTKENLMEELKKVKRVINKASPGAPHEVILVIDANSGQNARVQAQQFNEALAVTSLIVTKLDGTARGGVIVSIAEEVGLGVQFVGTGESISDLSRFSVDDYARGLLKL